MRIWDQKGRFALRFKAIIALFEKQNIDLSLEKRVFQRGGRLALQNRGPLSLK